MARNYAKIHTDIWSDEDFKSLGRDLQHLYFVVVSQPRLGMCGLLDYFPQRLAGASYSLTTDDVESSIKGLEERRYVVIDRDTSELLVRTFMRNDGVFGSPNLAVAAVREYGEVMSQKVRDAIETELVKCRRIWPNETTWQRVRDINPVLIDKVCERANA
jgi:hypothetical protein